jgi:hypothetical protein
VIVEGVTLRAVDHARDQPLVLQAEARVQQHPVCTERSSERTLRLVLRVNVAEAII